MTDIMRRDLSVPVEILSYLLEIGIHIRYHMSYIEQLINMSYIDSSL